MTHNTTWCKNKNNQNPDKRAMIFRLTVDQLLWLILTDHRVRNTDLSKMQTLISRNRHRLYGSLTVKLIHEKERKTKNKIKWPTILYYMGQSYIWRICFGNCITSVRVPKSHPFKTHVPCCPIFSSLITANIDRINH